MSKSYETLGKRHIIMEFVSDLEISDKSWTFLSIFFDVWWIINLVKLDITTYNKTLTNGRLFSLLLLLYEVHTLDIYQ